MTTIQTALKPVNLTGKYKKSKNITKEESIKQLQREADSNFYDNNDGMTIESLVSQHFASSIDNSSYSDGIAYYHDNLSVMVCVDTPQVYKIELRVESCDDDMDLEMELLMKIANGEKVNLDDYNGTPEIHVNIKALWNCHQNVLFISKDECHNSHELLKNFKNKPKTVSQEVFNCILAY